MSLFLGRVEFDILKRDVINIFRQAHIFSPPFNFESFIYQFVNKYIFADLEMLTIELE